jgi:hypothetical protein
MRLKHVWRSGMGLRYRALVTEPLPFSKALTTEELFLASENFLLPHLSRFESFSFGRRNEAQPRFENSQRFCNVPAPLPPCALPRVCVVSEYTSLDAQAREPSLDEDNQKKNQPRLTKIQVPPYKA